MKAKNFLAMLMVMSVSAVYMESAQASTPKACVDVFKRKQPSLFDQLDIFEQHAVKFKLDGRRTKNGEITFLRTFPGKYSFAFKAKVIKDIFISKPSEVQAITHAQNYKLHEENFVRYAVVQLRSNIGNPRLLTLDLVRHPFKSLSQEILSNVLSAKNEVEVAEIIRLAYRDFNGLDLNNPAQTFIEQGLLPGEKPYSESLLDISLSTEGILEAVNFANLPSGSYNLSIRYDDGTSDSAYFMINR